MSTQPNVPGDAKGFCRTCGTPLTAETLREVRGALYCEPCLARMVAQPAPAERVNGKPVLAAILGLIPGLGAVYNSEYAKGLIHFLIFVALVTTASHGGPQPLTGLLIAGLFVYMSIEAYVTAKARLTGQKAPSALGGWETKLPLGPILLIAFGVMLLADKFGMLDLEQLSGFFLPIVLIVAGALWLIRRRGGDEGSTEAPSHE